MNVYGTGNVTADAELKELGEKKTKLVEFTIAANKKGKDDKPEVSYFDVKAWGYAAGNAEKFKKGDFVVVIGELKQERWEKDGKKNSKVVITSFRCFKIADKEKAEEAGGQDQVPF